ncbi:threonine ammonia-lyase [Eubacterium coprostanoligenes]|uniref:L-threonine dehydratase catabolic TdcB n=1 Tax=Eubacterium coprostanoligenes TaxID=290054 RepID=A0A1T4LYI0_9FIRM|nr:threonine ammonia-lyase [Eubacterium coprostanoligenes]MCI6254510.1 threonine ammonia-lyase [Eubacterium coprostanoligenes]MCI6354968.1 threonine ammonia-lyase [Eubacterium coprostanoligenes]MCI6361533.1 threonine ammonia-lyase [Eubacterium coprostanoligenes]MDD6665709.1 threonine ammonia-lyase [Eubacterium coprostanoligenes]MDD7357906.1 threonine ammonia-lyase [Eubacterium coprostanoligenes]
MLSLDRVYKASTILKEIIRETDLIAAPNLHQGCNVYLKTENLQVTGSFKIRGSYFKISQLTEEEKKKGVIACSAGNHAQGVALAATKNGIKSIICLPDGAPISKVEATKRYGAEVCLVKGVYDDAYNKALELKDEKGLTFIHPFNDPDVIAGQGTIGLEILNQLPSADVVVVPIGGGGLISGIAYTIKQLKPNCKVYGVQAAGAPSMEHSIADGEIETLDYVNTIADGIAVKTPGSLTYDICNEYVDGIVTVTDDEIALAILTLLEQQKLIAEGAGAVPVAAVMNGKIPDVDGKNVVCVVSGGNIDVTILSRVIERGLKMGGRTADIVIALSDKPGQLSGVSQIVAEQGANVVSVNYDSTDLDMNITDCYLKIGVETRNFEHIVAVKKALTDAGFKVLE